MILLPAAYFLPSFVSFWSNPSTHQAPPAPMKFLPALLLLLLAAPLPALRAQDLPRAKAEEESAVRALLGKKGIVTGTVTDAFESPKGMTFLNLDGGKFTLVAWKDSYEKFEGGSPAKLYKGKIVEVTGAIEEYRTKGASKDDPGKLQIRLNSPDQVKVLTTPEPEADPKDAGKKGVTKESKDKASKTKKDATPTEDKKETKTDPAKEKTERVDPKKYFK